MPGIDVAIICLYFTFVTEAGVYISRIICTISGKSSRNKICTFIYVSKIWGTISESDNTNTSL